MVRTIHPHFFQTAKSITMNDEKEAIAVETPTLKLNELGKPDPNVKSNIILPSGKNAVIYKSKGKHIRQAQKIMGDDSSMYFNALFSILCYIDGQRLTLEDFDEMDGDDYTELQVAVAENFTKSTPKT